MNDNDKEAFNKYICSHDQGILQHSDDTDIDVAERAWQAACEYKQKEINEIELREAKTNRGFVELASKFCSLRSENEKLRNCAEFYADTGSWEAVQASDDSTVSGVISQDDIYEPWGEQGISVGGRRAKEVLKELDKENG